MRVRFAAIAIVAVLLLSSLSLILAQPPDCTTKECRYLPIIQRHFALTEGPTEGPTGVPTATVEQPTLTPTRDPNQCAAEYPTVCIPPPPPDLDCPDIPYRNIVALPPDRHNFDTDNDQIGCESGI